MDLSYSDHTAIVPAFDRLFITFSVTVESRQDINYPITSATQTQHFVVIFKAKMQGSTSTIQFN